MAQYTPLKKRTRTPADAGVYASLDELVRLRARASGYSFLPRQPVHSILAGKHASRLRGRGLNFEELRNYLPGDDTRNIDWKVTARTREPWVRVYTEEKDRVAWLVVDQRLNMFFGSRERMKSVTAAEAAASAAWRSLAQGDRVGAVVFNDSEMRIVPPHRSEARVSEILKVIVTMNHALQADADIETNPGMFNQVLQRVAALARHDALVSLITDGTGVDDESRRYVSALTEHNDVLAAIVFDPLEQALPEAGRLVATDGRQQLEIDSGQGGFQKAYQADFDERLERFRRTSRKHAIPLLMVSTAEPVLEQIRRQLGLR